MKKRIRGIEYEMSKFKFVTTVSRMGEEKRIIWIPKKYHDEIDAKFKNKQVKVVIDDEF